MLIPSGLSQQTQDCDCRRVLYRHTQPRRHHTFPAQRKHVFSFHKRRLWFSRTTRYRGASAHVLHCDAQPRRHTRSLFNTHKQHACLQITAHTTCVFSSPPHGDHRRSMVTADTSSIATLRHGVAHVPWCQCGIHYQQRPLKRAFTLTPRSYQSTHRKTTQGS